LLGIVVLQEAGGGPDPPMGAIRVTLPNPTAYENNFFTILYSWEDSIHCTRSFCHPVCCHNKQCCEVHFNPLYKESEPI